MYRPLDRSTDNANRHASEPTRPGPEIAPWSRRSFLASAGALTAFTSLPSGTAFTGEMGKPEKTGGESMHYDAVVIGGSYAGLSAAMQLARAGRTVCVVDDGKPRNRFADAAHGFFGQDGMPPLQMIAHGRENVAKYPNVTMVQDKAVNAAADGPELFRISFASGKSITATRLVLAYGIVDILPEIPGLTPRWGKTVIHCPYCHGYEFKGKQLGVLNLQAGSAHQALLVADWGPVAFFLNGRPSPDEKVLAQLAARGVKLEPEEVVSLEGEGTSLSGARLAGGRLVPIAAMYIAAKNRLGNDLAEQLGCALDDGPSGPVVRVDVANMMTTVRGVYAAGDITRMQNSATFASSGGVLAGASLHQALVFEPLG